MTVLGLETSSSICSVGLATDGGSTSARSLDAGSIHSEKLLTLVKLILKENALGLSGIDAVAVSSGPGSFTGLRIGFSAAKGLCLSMEKPLIVVPTFEALTLSVLYARPEARNILVALDAKKGDFYMEMFGRKGNKAGSEGEIRLVRGSDVVVRARTVNGTLVVVTDREPEVRSVLGEIPAEIEDARKHFRGDEIAALGLQKILNGETADGEIVEPLYLKDFVVGGRPSAV